MDIKKTMAAVNEFQNAAERVRPFMTLVEKAAIAWAALKEIDEASLQAMTDEKTKLIESLTVLNQKYNVLATQYKELQPQYEGKTKELASKFDTMKKEAEASFSARQAQITADLSGMEEKLKAARNDYERELSALLAQKNSLNEQISSLKSQAQQILHA